MKNKYLIPFILMIISTYYLLFFTALNYPEKQDFTSFYAALLSFKNHAHPYANLHSKFLLFSKVLTPNLNPPIALWIFSPLTYFNYKTALIIWLILSFSLGLIGAWIAFYYTFSIRFLKKNGVLLLLLFLSFFPTLINTVLAQFGLILLFFLMVGYYFFLSNRNLSAGICWGFCIALKFFPALLFFYLFRQGRINTFLIVLTSSLFLSLIPLFTQGIEIYWQYFELMNRVFWYGDNWNASVYGYLFRLFGYQDKLLLELIFIVLFMILLFWYFRNLQPPHAAGVNHQPFCFTLAMMLLISPFGWVYYFPILVFPLALIWASAIQETESTAKTILLWILTLFLINLPQGYVSTHSMQNFAVRLISSSFYFYGLVLLIYLLVNKETLLSENNIKFPPKNGIFLFIMLFIFLFGVIITPIKILLTG